MSSWGHTQHDQLKRFDARYLDEVWEWSGTYRALLEQVRCGRGGIQEPAKHETHRRMCQGTTMMRVGLVYCVMTLTQHLACPPMCLLRFIQGLVSLPGDELELAVAVAHELSEVTAGVDLAEARLELQILVQQGLARVHLILRVVGMLQGQRRGSLQMPVLAGVCRFKLPDVLALKPIRGVTQDGGWIWGPTFFFSASSFSCTTSIAWLQTEEHVF